MVVALVVVWLAVTSGALQKGVTQDTDVITIAGTSHVTTFAEMVVEYKGFRGRWQSSAASAGAPVFHADGSEHSPLSCQHSNNDLELVDDVDSFGFYELPMDDCDDAAATEGVSAPEESDRRRPFFMRLTPKSAALPSNSLSLVSMSIERTADEVASKQVHRVIADIKQPWQIGPLSVLFSKRTPFWERLQRQNKLTMVGISDHIAASSSSSSIPKPVQQTELTVQRIRASRLVASQDNFRHLALSRFKMMVLLDLDCTRLGQSLRSFAGTLCSNEKQSQIFMDVFAPKATGTVLKRCNSRWRFSCWLQSQCTGFPFSQSEMALGKYICHLRDVGAGSTTMSQLVEASRFADNLVGFTQVRLQDMLGFRITGVAHSFFMTKRMIYSRNNQIKLCHKLNQMFAKIRNGQFGPDATRVNRTFQLAYNAVLENESTDDSSESSSDPDAPSVASSDGEHGSVSQKPRFKRLAADNMETDLCLINSNSQVFHLLASEDEKFWRGRHPSASFKRVSREDLNATEAAICANCSHSYRAAGHG